MTGREWQHGLLRARPMERQRQAHPRPGLALGVLPDHAPRGSRPRAAGLQHARSADWRPWRQPAERRARGQLGQLRATPRRDLPLEREHRAAQRLRHHLQPDSVGARPARRQHLPGNVIARDLHQQRAVRLVLDDQPGHPDHPGARHQQRQVPAAEHGPTMRTPEVGNVDRACIQSWNVAVRASPAVELRASTSPTSPTEADGGYADLDVNAPTTSSAAATRAVPTSRRWAATTR